MHCKIYRKSVDNTINPFSSFLFGLTGWCNLKDMFGLVLLCWRTMKIEESPTIGIFPCIFSYVTDMEAATLFIFQDWFRHSARGKSLFVSIIQFHSKNARLWWALKVDYRFVVRFDLCTLFTNAWYFIAIKLHVLGWNFLLHTNDAWVIFILLITYLVQLH